MSEDMKPYGDQVRRDEPTPDELRALIARTGLSQRRAAEAIDVSERMMRYYASGQEKIPRNVLFALRWLASQASASMPTDYWGTLPDGEVYFMCPRGESLIIGGGIGDRFATGHAAVARVRAEQLLAEGKPQDIWLAKRIDLAAPTGPVPGRR